MQGSCNILSLMIWRAQSFSLLKKYHQIVCRPGMNRCDISEDETTNALNALYVTPVPATGVSSGVPHTAAAGTATSSTYNISGHLEQSRKRKNALKDGNGMAESSYPMPASIPLMSNQQAPTKNKKTVDGEHYPFEGDSVSKHGPGPVSRSADFVVEKQKSKHKNRSSYSDGGIVLFHICCLCFV